MSIHPNASYPSSKEISPCVICGSREKIIALKREFEVLECSHCRYGHVFPLPTASELKRLYDSADYFGEHMSYSYADISESEIERLVTSSGNLHMQKLGPLLSPNSSILEIGPGGGFALKYFERHGHRVTGIETSASSVQFASDRLGIKLEHCQLESYQFKTGFDLILMNHVLEHFVDIRLAMSKISQLVRPNGLVYVRVPNHDSYDRRVMGGSWPAYVPYHISYFSERALRLLFEQTGFEVIGVDEFMSEAFGRGLPERIRGVLRAVLSKIGGASIWNGRTIRVIARKRMMPD